MFYFFFFNDTATTEIYTLSLHDALPIYHAAAGRVARIYPRERAGDLEKTARRGPALAANGRGQRSKHQWLPARGSEPTRITGCLARCAGFGPHHRGQSG